MGGRGGELTLNTNYIEKCNNANMQQAKKNKENRQKKSGKYWGGQWRWEGAEVNLHPPPQSLACPRTGSSYVEQKYVHNLIVWCNKYLVFQMVQKREKNHWQNVLI